MATSYTRVPKDILAVTILWSFALILLFGFWWFTSDGRETSEYYLVPWTMLAGTVLLAPSFYLHRKGEFDIFHPLVFGVWSYIFPAFVIGALIITFGLNEPYFFNFIETPQSTLPLAIGYVMVGYLGMCLGFFIPVGGSVITRIKSIIPKSDWSGLNAWLAGGILLLMGVGINILGFLQGLLGYQKVSESAIFDGLISFLTVFLTMGFILLWSLVFREKSLGILHYVVIAVLFATIPLRMALLGNRGGLLAAVIPIGIAFAYSGRKLKVAHGFAFGFLVLASLMIGILYGTAFRQIKGSEERIATGAYMEQVAATIEYIGRADFEVLVTENVRTLADRIDTLSSLGVVVSNYERLAPYEAQFGIENNIINDLSTSLIPRFFWADKPPTADPRAYSDLYFDYGDNSFAITPFGDLLRNFGFIGIPLGMLLVGLYFKFIYTVLVDSALPKVWAVAAYYPLLTVVSYEGFYSTFIPSALRVAFVVGIPLVILHFLFFRKSPRETTN